MFRYQKDDCRLKKRMDSLGHYLQTTSRYSLYLLKLIQSIKMKVVYFIRHAKSSWEDMSLSDADRPLNRRGKRDAPFMAKLLKGKDVKPSAIISSPANRALTTAKVFAEELGIAAADIMIKESIYEAYTEDVLHIIKALSNDLETVLIFGHNPTFTSLSNMFTDDYIPNVPTCGITRILSSTDDWAKFDRNNAALTDLYYPKQYL